MINALAVPALPDVLMAGGLSIRARKIPGASAEDFVRQS
jgi:hypothetical protein